MRLRQKKCLKSALCAQTTTIRLVKSIPKDKHRFDMVFVVIDRLSKQAISEPCYKTVTAKEMAQIYIQTIYRYYRPLQTIVSDRSP